MSPQTDRIFIAKLDLETDNYIKKQDQVQETIEILTKKRDELAAGGRREREELKKVQLVLDAANKEYHDLAAEITASITANRSYIDNQYKLETALKATAKTHREYNELNDELADIRLALNPLSASYNEDLANINAKMSENNTVLKEQTELQTAGYLSMDFYKKKVTESFDAINVFNGGISGFISRAQSAGGVGKLFSSSISGMTAGIKGMGAAISANPIGFLLSILGPVIEKLTTFTPVTRAVEQAMAALSPVLNLVTKPLQWLATGIGAIINGFSSLVGSMSDSAKKATELADAEQKLNTQKILQERLNEKATQQIDALIKKSENETLSIKERTKAHEDAAAAEKKNLDAQKAIADESYRIALQKLQQSKSLNIKDIEILENGTAQEVHALAETKNITDEELQTLEKLHVEKKRLAKEEITMLEQQKERKKAILKEQADNEKQAVDDAIKKQKDKLALFVAENASHKQSFSQRIAFEKDFSQRSISILKQELSAKKISQDQYKAQVIQLQTQQKNNITQIQREQAQDAIAIQKLELEKFIADHGTKARTLQEELDFTKDVSKQKEAIIKAEYAMTDKTRADTLQRDKDLQELRNETTRKSAEVTVENAEKELQAYKEANQSKLEDDRFVSLESVTLEKQRLEAIALKEKEYQKARFENGIIDQNQLNDELKAIEQKLLEDKEALNLQFKDAETTRSAIDLENKRAASTANLDYDLTTQLKNLNDLKDQELKAAEKTGADKKLIEDKYAKLEKDTRKSVMDNKLDLANQTFGNLQAILGKESAAGKAMAVAQATIDTYKSAVSAYGAMSGIPVIGPTLGAIAAAAAVAAGVQNVKKITATKTPKAEKGALFSIGGKRHSQGGTLFTGQDGTRFEAEAGEVIGVMNRNAARHFMAFNNAFPTGGGSGQNYFASGGIVSREVAPKGLDMDELAAKIAQANASIPAPVVAVQDILTQSNSYVKVRQGANF
nr:hypothetical protein [uncultured Flavobacterium sp.]